MAGIGKKVTDAAKKAVNDKSSSGKSSSSKGSRSKSSSKSSSSKGSGSGADKAKRAAKEFLR